MAVFLLKSHNLSSVLRFVLAFAIRLRLLHGSDGVLPLILCLSEVIFSLVALFLQELKFTFPECLIFVISVYEILVFALVIHVFMTEAFKLNMNSLSITLVLDIKVLNLTIELHNLVFIIFDLLFTLVFEVRELHGQHLFFTHSILSLFIESSLNILELFTLAIEFSFEVSLFSLKSISFFFRIAYKFFSFSLKAVF
jgi:hypothetical protein